LDESQIRETIRGRTVMVTGAAGSIGSELCRQVARFGPKLLVAFEQAESDLFRIDNELTLNFPGLAVIPQVGDIRDYVRVQEVIRAFHVDSIFHAAAYKHVPMMENHVMEAVKNNIIGTRNVVCAAAQNNVARFLMISSDKAVNPTNIMGATKRVAELIVSAFPLEGDGGKTKCVSVRFGNVLGSNGSVIPVFREQIARGGPVTVTHPDMRRYFMTIPEAVQLVLQASIMGKGSEIFVLDMGEPVRIVDLARNMIRLSGHEPDGDIEIRYTGLRPGEKLFEELSTKDEHIQSTYHEKIKIFAGRRLRAKDVETWISELEALLLARDEPSIVEHIRELVPEYGPSEEQRRPAAELAEKTSSTVA
ncbi:MAG: polysaccharide biosynthesis protein CapD, partial [Bryobacterales bacterium]|nr:polysaccharide biosynthesis protein CapD [Bryobacterales bacterium]